VTTIDLAIADAPDVVSRSEHQYATTTWSGARYRVRARPGLRVRVEDRGDTKVMIEAETGVHGAGADIRDAWRNLGQALIEHVDVLRRQDSLPPELAHQLDYLTARLAS
jgi:predicted RNase H-like HicB family nuclease